MTDLYGPRPASAHLLCGCCHSPVTTLGAIAPGCGHPFHSDCIAGYNPPSRTGTGDASIGDANIFACPWCRVLDMLEAEEDAETTFEGLAMDLDVAEKGEEMEHDEDDEDEELDLGTWWTIAGPNGWVAHALLESTATDPTTTTHSDNDDNNNNSSSSASRLVKYFHLESPTGDIAVCKFKPKHFSPGHAPPTHQTVFAVDHILRTVCQLPQFELNLCSAKATATATTSIPLLPPAHLAPAPALFTHDDSDHDSGASRATANANANPHHIFRILNGDFCTIGIGHLLDRTPCADVNRARIATIIERLHGCPPFSVEWAGCGGRKGRPVDEETVREAVRRRYGRW